MLEARYILITFFFVIESVFNLCRFHSLLLISQPTQLSQLILLPHTTEQSINYRDFNITYDLTLIGLYRKLYTGSAACTSRHNFIRDLLGAMGHSLNTEYCRTCEQLTRVTADVSANQTYPQYYLSTKEMQNFQHLYMTVPETILIKFPSSRL